MDADKRQRYERISTELTKLVGGRENIQGVAHCATRLRIVLKDNDLADLKAIQDAGVDLYIQDVPGDVKERIKEI